MAAHALVLLGSWVLACGSPTQTKAAAPVQIPEPAAAAETTDDVPAPSSNDAPSKSPEDVLEGYREDDVETISNHPWGSFPGATGGPDCDDAADCCHKVLLASTGGNASLNTTCDSIRQAPTQACANMLRTFAQAGPSLGVTCP